MVERIVSGGQTGADRGGLEAAIALGIPHGGWCPQGRRAEDGTIPARYQLQETSSAQYHVRTRRNARDSDGTLLFTRGRPTGGSRFTAEVAEEIGKPLLVVEITDAAGNPETTAARLLQWLSAHRIRTLNVAGPRESKVPGIEAAVKGFLEDSLSAFAERFAYPSEGERRIADTSMPAAAEAPAHYRHKPKRS